MGLPAGNWFLNAKDRKRLLQALHEQFGVGELPGAVFIQNAKDRVYVLNRDIERIDFESLRIDSAGLYLGTWQADGFRLSVEGSQLLAGLATKNVVRLDLARKHAWLKGEDVPWEGDGNAFVIVKFEEDVLGCGKVRQPRAGDAGVVLLNYVPKSRQLVVINE